VRSAALTLLLCLGTAYAQDADEAALALADKTETQAARTSDWRVLTEGALIESIPRNGGSPTRAQRLSLDALYDTRLAANWRAVVADRLDLAWRGEPTYDDLINTLKEAYVSWQPNADNIADAGRINLRYGVATGYNPTDYFRANALRSVVSVAPTSLRENRLGTAMLRGQTLWAGGSLAALYAPKLADPSNGSPFSPDFGATNNQDRWLIALSQKLADDFNPQMLLYSDERNPPQLGVNLTRLLNDATVAYLEYSGGRSASLLAQAQRRSDNVEFRSRASAGLTYTAPSKLSVTLEYEYNAAGLDRNDWNALRRGAPGAYLQYRGFVQALQDLPTTQSVFVAARWQDALFVHFDLSGFQRIDVIDYSRLSFLEARYHWDHADLALQWQHNSGEATSEFGASPQRTVWQAVVTYFF
jgi:hypothetical protein